MNELEQNDGKSDDNTQLQTTINKEDEANVSNIIKIIRNIITVMQILDILTL